MDTSQLQMLGPLAALVGIWEGAKGDDVAPGDDRGTENNKYRERYTFVPTGQVDNHEQKLYGLKYTRIAWRVGADVSFHEEMGFWLWDAKEKQVMRSFLIPRGMTVLAGATVEPSARKFKLESVLGSKIYGICSNPFLDREFQTVKFEVSVDVTDGNFSYKEITSIQMKDHKDVFAHTDQNTLSKVSN